MNNELEDLLNKQEPSAVVLAEIIIDEANFAYWSATHK